MVDKSQPPYPQGQHPNSKAAFRKMTKLAKTPLRSKRPATNVMAGIDPHRADARLRRFD